LNQIIFNINQLTTKEMKTIGTDVSLSVCKAEGYTMIQFDARKKFDENRQIRIFSYYPEYCEGYSGQIMTDTNYSFVELKETYERYKQGMDSCCETGKFVNFEKPTYKDFLFLASDISSYCGLD